MKSQFLIVLLSFVLATSTKAQQTPSADAVLQEAYAKAAKENKKIMVIFHASWCVWCHKMDSSLNDASVKDYFDKNYVITHLTINESANKKALENAGAMELKSEWGGAKIQSIPYWVILDKEGKVLADSQIESGKNVGCPANEEEVQHFINVLKKTSLITNEQVASVEKRFREND